MAKHKIDQTREERIQTEIVVDCYNESERYSGWICYLEEKLDFPIRARCIAPRKASPLKRGEQVEILGMLDEDRDTPSEIFVLARWQGRELGLPLAQLEGTKSAIRPPKPSPIGITGVRADTASNHPSRFLLGPGYRLGVSSIIWRPVTPLQTFSKVFRVLSGSRFLTCWRNLKRMLWRISECAFSWMKT
jgi:hypothetical protein